MTLFRKVEGFERSINVAVHFDHCKTDVPRLQGSRCRLQSAWQPPKRTSVSTYCRLLRMELSQYSPGNRTKNADFIDRAAQTWLCRHSSQVCIVDADKNLGDAIISRSWVTQESLRLLQEAAFVTSHDQYVSETEELKHALDSFLHAAMFRRIISDKEGKFIMSMFSSMRTGSFRLRVKLHKTPIKGRPIFNMTQSWLAPAAVYLVDVLQPLEKLLSHTISSSSELMDLLEGKQILNPSARLFATYTRVWTGSISWLFSRNV